MHVLEGHQRLRFVQEWYLPGKVLDVGCGQGAFALWCHQQGCDVTMTDILPVTPPNPHIRFRQESVYDLQDVNIYDTVLLMEVIEHLEWPEKAIKKGFDALKYRGRLLITTPHVPNWDHVQDHVWRFDRSGVYDLLCPYNSFRLWDDPIFVYAVVRKE